NVWIGSAPSGMVQKYAHDGSKLLFQIGKKGAFDSSDGTSRCQPLNSNAAQFFMPSSIFVDRQNGDVYVSEGESRGGNRGVAVGASATSPVNSTSLTASPSTRGAMSMSRKTAGRGSRGSRLLVSRSMSFRAKRPYSWSS